MKWSLGEVSILLGQVFQCIFSSHILLSPFSLYVLDVTSSFLLLSLSHAFLPSRPSIHCLPYIDIVQVCHYHYRKDNVFLHLTFSYATWLQITWFLDHMCLSWFRCVWYRESQATHVKGQEIVCMSMNSISFKYPFKAKNVLNFPLPITLQLLWFTVISYHLGEKNYISWCMSYSQQLVYQILQLK